MSEHIGFRCPDDIIAAIREQMEASGKGRTEVLVEMLRSAMPSMLVSDRAKLPNEPAIYFVWSGQRLLYIGKTNSLCRRFMNHHKLADFVLAGEDTRVSWLPADSENLTAFESSLIGELEPELNEVFPMTGNTVLATFKIDREKWEPFRDMATAEGVSASSLIKEFIDWYMAGNRISISIDATTPDDIDSRIEALLDKKLDERLGKYAA